MDADKIILIILALFLPPVAVFMKEGATMPLWINIVLCLIVYFPGMLHALYIVFKDE